RHPPSEPRVATRLGELLDEERHRGFVGRGRELAAFDAAVAGRSPCRVLFVHGPGGIGKTTLLLELRTRARAAGRTVVLLDARDVDASPDGFRDALAGATGAGGGLPTADLAAGTGGLPAGAVLMVDGYEQLKIGRAHV